MSAARQGSRRASGAVAVLLVLLLVITGGAFAGVEILQTKWAERDALATQLESLQRRRPAQPSDAREVAITVKPFLVEENFALAANALQKRVVGLIEQTEGKLITVSVDPPVLGDEELARRVSVQVTAELTNEALQKVLYELETGVPFAFVESFAASRRQTGDGAANEATQAAPRLAVSLNVTGYRRKGSK
jgi:general secretion pathway protein M